jgi:RNA polymerase sigma-54 factor
MGYLSVSLEEISKEFNISIEKLESVLRIVQSLEPPGVGARDIKECLLIQLREKGNYPLAERIITDYMNELRLRKYNEIAKKLRVSRAKLKEMINIISSLEPYPGRQFYSEGIRYIIPDVIVERRDGKLEVTLNATMIPRLRVNRYFEELLRKRDIDGRVRDFVSERVRRARAFIQSIEQRENTLIRVTKAIIEHQPEFFEKGPLYLRPMTLKDIARAVDLHESTVSRITSSKYVQTPFGVFRLKYFFSTSIQSEDRRQISTRSIKELIREIIENESSGSRKKLSDQKIAEILSKRGIKIARRTVAKYRKELQILPSNIRRP